jgi:membrane-associated phospholipid phosphatase
MLADPIVLALLYCLIVSLVFLAWPAIDLWFSGAFYDSLSGFAAADDPALRLLRASGNWAMDIVIVVVLASLVGKIAWPSRGSLVPPSVSLFLLSTLAVATGLLVNVILKDHWGRPRPRTVTAFGGDLPYVEVWRISRYCLGNCSFVAGEASSAIWLTALAFVVPRRWRWPVLVVTGLFALALSVNRIAFGGHFLSDVMLSWGLTALVIAVLYRVVIARPPAWLENDRLEAGLARIGNAVRRPFTARPG